MYLHTCTIFSGVTSEVYLSVAHYLKAGHVQQRSPYRREECTCFSNRYIRLQLLDKSSVMNVEIDAS